MDFNCKSNWIFSKLYLLIYIYIYIYVGSRFSDWAHYNEFVEIELVQLLGSNEVTTCFGGEKYSESDGLTSQGERTPRPRTGTPNSSFILGASLLSLGLLAVSPSPPLSWVISVVIYHSLPFILLLHLSVIHACARVHVPLVTLFSLYELLWPPSHCPGVTSMLMESGW